MEKALYELIRVAESLHADISLPFLIKYGLKLSGEGAVNQAMIIISTSIRKDFIRRLFAPKVTEIYEAKKQMHHQTTVHPFLDR